jgi:hypothetical protein
MAEILLKSTVIWFAFLVLAILNAGLREKVLDLLLGKRVALILSGLLLALLILVFVCISIPWLGIQSTTQALLIGAGWGVATFSFEIGLARLRLGQGWAESLRIFDVTTGNLMMLVLLITVFAPYLCARLRGLI